MGSGTGSRFVFGKIGDDNKGFPCLAGLTQPAVNRDVHKPWRRSRATNGNRRIALQWGGLQAHAAVQKDGLSGHVIGGGGGEIEGEIAHLAQFAGPRQGHPAC